MRDILFVGDVQGCAAEVHDLLRILAFDRLFPASCASTASGTVIGPMSGPKMRSPDPPDCTRPATDRGLEETGSRARGRPFPSAGRGSPRAMPDCWGSRALTRARASAPHPCLLAAPLAAEAEQPAHIPRIGVLQSGAQSPRALKAFHEGLAALGHVDGKTIVIEWQAAEVRIDRQAALVSELIRLPVDVIVVATTGAALAAKQLTTTIPIVSAAAGALVEAGVVASLAHSGGNVTGLTTMEADVSAKRLELLKALGVTIPPSLLQRADQVIE